MITFQEYHAKESPEISMNLPLLIRVFEYIMDDIKTDVQLHEFVEKIMKVGLGKTLTMADYNEITK